jgi:hypothetical protein
MEHGYFICNSIYLPNDKIEFKLTRKKKLLQSIVLHDFHFKNESMEFRFRLNIN